MTVGAVKTDTGWKILGLLGFVPIVGVFAVAEWHESGIPLRLALKRAYREWKYAFWP